LQLDGIQEQHLHVPRVQAALSQSKPTIMQNTLMLLLHMRQQPYRLQQKQKLQQQMQRAGSSNNRSNASRQCPHCWRYPVEIYQQQHSEMVLGQWFWKRRRQQQHVGTIACG
jgi:hypothetical protein